MRGPVAQLLMMTRMSLFIHLFSVCSAARPWAVVTGSSSGIGRSIAIEAASRGYNVVVTARRRAALDDLCSMLRQTYGIETLAVAVDLGKPNGAAELHRATSRLPSVDLVVANAGFSAVGPLVEEPVDRIEQMIAVNMASVATLCRLYGADLAAAGRGTLLITSSLTALAPLPFASLYGATRSFVHSLASGLAAELRPQNVKVHCLLPGSTDSGFAATSGIESALAFNGPFFRPLGVVSSSSAVAVAALDAVEGGDDTSSTDVYVSFLQRCYAVMARALLPRSLAGGFASAFFGPKSPLGSASDLVAFLPTFVPVLPALLVAMPVAAVQEAMRMLPTPLFVLLLLGLLIAINIAQNGIRAGGPPPLIRTVASAREIRCKGDFVAAWLAAPPPTRERFAGVAFNAELPVLGALAPASALITHQLFGGLGGGPWLGKGFDATRESGKNRFKRAGACCEFRATVSPSWYDGKPALVLDYSAGDSWLWGRVLGMRDELREVSPGVWLGLGSFWATGGMRNSAPFLMFPAAETKAE